MANTGHSNGCSTFWRETIGSCDGRDIAWWEVTGKFDFVHFGGKCDGRNEIWREVTGILDKRNTSWRTGI